MPNWKQKIRNSLPLLGVNALARQVTARLPRVLMYHRFRESRQNDPRAMDIGVFRRQMNYIKQHFRPLTVQKLFQEYDHRGRYPKHAVAVTVDDAYRDFIELAYPVLVELQIPATIFAVSQLVEDSSWIWADKVNYILEQAAGQTSEASSIDIPALSHEAVFAELTRLPLADRDQRVVELSETLGIPIPAQVPARFRLMSWQELQEVQQHGLVEVGSHTMTHPIMSQLSSAESRREIEGSRAQLESHLGRSVTTFCFPNGQRGDFSAEQLKQLSQAGYRSGIASHFGYLTAQANRYAVPRLNYTDCDMGLFAKYLDGIEYLQRRAVYRADALRATDD